MGRKIPGKKHRGVKDPEKQQAKRLAAVETLINAPPKNIDHQDVPKSLERVIKLKNAVKDGSIGLKKNKKQKNSKKLIKLGAEQLNYKLPAPTARPEKVVPVFNQQPGESKYKFWNRVNQETEAFIKETEFELKYNVEVKRNAATGEVEGFRKKPKEELEQVALEKLQDKHSNIKKKKKKEKDGEVKVKLSKGQKRKQRLLEKKNKKLEDNAADNFLKYEDKVEFGEVAMAPPKLSLPRKAIKTDNKGKNLLLNKIFEENNSSKKENIKIDKSGKRKNLPLGERRNLEREQSNAIEAYRRLKAQKSANA